MLNRKMHKKKIAEKSPDREAVTLQHKRQNSWPMFKEMSVYSRTGERPG